MNARHHAPTIITLALATGLAVPAGSARAEDFPASWNSLGPAPLTNGAALYTGRCSAVAASATNQRKLYVAAASGGVWKTEDRGLSWTNVGSSFPTSAVGAIAVDPNDDNIVYVGSGEANFANHSFYGLGLYKTTDGGATWEVHGADTFSGRTFSKIVIAPDDSNVLFASIMHAGGFPARNAAKGHPLTDGPVGIFRSTDAGVTWEHLTNGLPEVAASDVAIHATDGSIVYAAIGDIFGHTDNGIYKSVDGGDSWTKLAGGLPTTNVGRIAIDLAPSMPDRVYALITNPSDAVGNNATTKGVYRTDNAGTAWAFFNPGTLLQSSYGWFLCVIEVDPTNADRVYAGGVSLVRSSNGGTSWSTVTPPHVDMHGLVHDAVNQLWCANDGGIHWSADFGASWFPFNSFGVIQFYPGLSFKPNDGVFVLGGAQDNGTAIRESTSTWTHRVGGDGGFTALHPNTPSTMFTEFQGSGNLYRSTNGGNTFNLSSSGINSGDRNCFVPPVVYDPNDSTRLFYGTHRVYRSINSGSNWTAISGDLTGGTGAIRSLAVAPSNSSVLYAATNDGRVLSSEDGGVNWDLRLTDVPGWPRVTRELAVDPEDAGTVYLAVSYFGVDQIRRSEDFGETWTALDGDLPDVPVNCVAVHRNTLGPVVLLGTFQGVYVSHTEGAAWRRLGDLSFQHVPVTDIRVDETLNRLLVGTMGRGAWDTKIPVFHDADVDGAVDLLDVAAQQDCFSGDSGEPGFIPPTQECLDAFDDDFDGDVDLLDHAPLVSLLTGPAE